MEEMDFSDIDMPEKEKKILKAAINLFSEKGFNAATTSEIAKSAGVAEGTIFRYYKTKKDILRGILIQALNLSSGKVVMSGVDRIFDSARDKDLRTILKELLRDRLQLVENFFPMFRVIMTEAVYHEDIRQAIYENIIKKAVDSFTLFHKQMAERGLIRSDIPSPAVLRSTLGSLAILIAQRMLFSDKFSTDFEADIDYVVDILLYGLVPRDDVNRG